MSIPAAYIGIIVIWTTTPLAVKWSGEGSGFLFGVTGRMLIGAVLATALLYLTGKRLVWHKRARMTYFVGGLGIYGAMLSVYWGVQFIPSGWVSIIFGLSPILTGILAALWLEEKSLSPSRVFGMTLGVAGMALVFYQGMQLSAQSVFGIAAVVFSTLIHSVSAVWIKKIEAALPGMTMTTGSLIVAVLLFLATWFVTDTHWPQQIELRSGASIVYLGVIGSVIGFALYFYVLSQVQAVQVSLITLITPVTALLLGASLNDEVITQQVWVGVVVISVGLLVFQWGSLIFKKYPALKDGQD